MDNLVKCKGVAALMQVDYKQVQRLGREGALPSIRIGAP